jgi:hypothetical protein
MRTRLAADGIRRWAERLSKAGHEFSRRAVVLVGAGMPDWSSDEIIAVHVRMHQAEGELFRDVLVAGARANGLAVASLREKTALDDAAKTARPEARGARRDSRVARKSVGAPWGKDQKEAPRRGDCERSAA